MGVATRGFPRDGIRFTASPPAARTGRMRIRCACMASKDPPGYRDPGPTLDLPLEFRAVFTLGKVIQFICTPYKHK